MTCLLGVELCAEVVKGVGDELLVWSRVLMAVFMAMGRLMGFFRGFPRFSRSSGLSRS